MQNQFFQHTVKNAISCKGIGLHSGKTVNLNIKPANPNEGITFVRTDIRTNPAIIKASYSNVVDTRLCTCIGDKNGNIVGTIEHLMFALNACSIDNAVVEIDAPEVPIMDGSAEPFIFLIKSAGIAQQNIKRKAIRILKSVKVQKDDQFVQLDPAEDKLFGNFSIAFKEKAIGTQEASFTFENLIKNVAKARTFGLAKEVEMLKAMGLAKGGSLENAIVVDNDKILNEEGLRDKNEFVLHKILDACGDLYTAGMPIIGTFTGNKSGHMLNNQLLLALFADVNNYEIVDLETVEQNIPQKQLISA